MYVALFALFTAIIGGISLANYNLQQLAKTKQERLEARRAFKKLKNERLRKFYGLDKEDKSKE